MDTSLPSLQVQVELETRADLETFLLFLLPFSPSLQNLWVKGLVEDNETKLRDSHKNEQIEFVRRLWLTRRHTCNDAKTKVLMDKAYPKRKLPYEIAF